MLQTTPLRTLLGGLAAVVLAVFSRAQGGACTGTGMPVTPGPAAPATGAVGPGGDFPLLPGAPGTPTGWPFEPGLLGPGWDSPSSVTGGATDLLAPTWLRWWRRNASAFLPLRAHVHRPPYRGGDVLAFDADATRAARQAPYFPSAEVVRARLLPELLELHRTEKQEAVRRALLRTLGRASRALPEAERAPVVELLIEALGERDPDTAETALIALGWTAHPRAARALAGVLVEDSDARRTFRTKSIAPRLRVHAALGLGRVAAEQHVDLRRYAFRVLSGVLESADESVPHVSVASLLALTRTAPVWSDAPDAHTLPGTFQHASDLLVTLFLDREAHDSVRAQAALTWARWIAELPEPYRRAEKERFLPLVLGRLDADLDDTLLAACVVALGDVADEDDDPLDRRVVERLLDLDAISPPRWVEQRRWMELARIVTRGGDAPTTGRSRTQVVGALSEALVQANDAERVWVVLALGRLGHELTRRGEDVGDPVRQALRLRLSEKASADEEAALCLALGWLRDLGSKELLEERFRQAAQLRVRAFAALGLGLLGERSSLELLSASQRGTILPDVELEIAVTLGRALLDDRDIGLVRLRELDRNVSVEAKLAQLAAIGEVGDVRALAPLLELASEGRDSALLRAAALSAAGRIAEPDLQTGPWRYVQDTSDAPWTTEVTLALAAR